MSKRRSPLPIYILSALLLSSLTQGADSPFDPYYGAYVLFPQGSVRVMAMGGAGAALNDDSTAIFFNPAGATIGDWKFDGGGTNNQVKNDELAYNFPSTYGSYETIYDAPYSYLFYSVAANLGPWSLGLGISSPFLMKYEYINPYSNRIIHTIEISIKSAEAMIARSLGDYFALGISFHAESLREYYQNWSLITPTGSYTDPYETRANNTYSSWGFMVHSKDKKVRFGVYHTPGRIIAVNRTEDDILEMFNTVVFRNVKVPSKTTFGFSWNIQDRLVLSIDLDRVDMSSNSIYVSSISTSYEYVNAENLEVLHGGLEYAIINSKFAKLFLRGGGYNEPTRFRNGKSRDHTTYGLEARFGPLVFTYGVDQSSNFYNSSQGFSMTKNF